MTFPVLKHTRFLPTAFRTILLFQRIPILSWNLAFEFLTRLCFIHLVVSLASNPRLLSFCTQYANDFTNPANPDLIPVFFCSTDNGEGGGGGVGGVKCERVESIFNQELTPIGPHPNFILFNPLHCYKIHSRCWRSPLVKTKIYGWSAQWFYI